MFGTGIRRGRGYQLLVPKDILLSSAWCFYCSFSSSLFGASHSDRPLVGFVGLYRLEARLLK